jgi:hypothetical protein
LRGDERSPFDFAAVKIPRHKRAETPSTTTEEGVHGAMALASRMITQGRLSTSVGTTGSKTPGGTPPGVCTIPVVRCVATRP